MRAISPRPFPLHLILAMSALAASRIGSPGWKPGWPSSNGPNLPESLAARLAAIDPDAFARALDHRIIAAQRGFAEGVAAYRRHPWRRPEERAPVVWREGSTALLDHGAGRQDVAEPAVLFAPSLINRGWVLDLTPGTGMLSWLAGQGVRPYRLEWGPPGPQEQGFGVADYVGRRLEPAMELLVRRTGRPVILAGYCMGGLLALAAALRRQDQVSALALLATPWDFHAEGAARGQAIGRAWALSRAWLAAEGALPVDAIQALFALHDPLVALRKFRRFGALSQNSAAARAFVALEDWLNDGVPLSIAVADEALRDWFGANVTGAGTWRLDGRLVDPAALTIPVLVATPGRDRIVPPGSAAAILPRLRRAEALDAPLGHIGMVVGRGARQALWRPLAAWMRRVAAQEPGAGT